MTEGALKGDLAHAVSGRTFCCVPGVNQYANLIPFLAEMKEYGTELVYEAYDMDKLTKTVRKSRSSGATSKGAAANLRKPGVLGGKTEASGCGGLMGGITAHG